MNSDFAYGDDQVKLIPLGGFAEIGKNMIIWECEDDAIVVDAGLAFPEEQMLGVDIVIPNIDYLLSIRDKVSGIFITHGHEDHIGALPYVLREMTVPVYGPGLALGLVSRKMKEFDLRLPTGSQVVRPRQRIRTSRFEIEFFRVNHSIADAMGLAIRTPGGLMVHSGDFKLDHTPIDGQVTDFYTLASLGHEGVNCLIIDSTNAEVPGYTPSEREVGRRLLEIFPKAPGRILMATFASNIPRLQQAIDAAEKFDRRVAVIGRSMENSVEVAREMGYIKAPSRLFIDANDIHSLPPENLLVLTTGSQGEPMSALSRMSRQDDRRLQIEPTDTIVIAANPVPGNEKLVFKTVDNLSKLGAHVIYGGSSGVHVSGHASREELKLMLNLIQPKFVTPVHGEYRHMKAFEGLVSDLGFRDNAMLEINNGNIIAFTSKEARRIGQIGSGELMVDGLGVGDVGRMVLRDREQLSQHGMVMIIITVDGKEREILGPPEVITRGFVYAREAEALIEEIRERSHQCAAELLKDRGPKRNVMKKKIRNILGNFLYQRLHRRPMVLPIIIDISEDDDLINDES